MEQKVSEFDKPRIPIVSKNTHADKSETHRQIQKDKRTDEDKNLSKG